ncbi:MAG: hypothetical protein IJ737_07250 [Ruminococcus sp.]|nr:hypothetical protein [Ruminococcus sp.]
MKLLRTTLFLWLGAAAGGAILLTEWLTGEVLLSFGSGVRALWLTAGLLCISRRREPPETFRDTSLLTGGICAVRYISLAVTDSIESLETVRQMTADGKAGQLAHGGGIGDWLCLPPAGELLLWLGAGCALAGYGALMCRSRKSLPIWTLMSLLPIGIIFTEAGELFLSRETVGTAAALAGGLASVFALILRIRKPETGEENTQQNEGGESFISDEEKWLL